MPKAHAIGMLLPQTPMPFQIVYPMAENSIPVPPRQIMKRNHQPLAVGFHTGAKTVSVRVRSSSGPSISGSGAISGEMVRTRSAMVDLRVAVLHARQVNRARA